MSFFVALSVKRSSPDSRSSEQKVWMTEDKFSVDNGVKITSVSQGSMKLEKKLNRNLDTGNPMPCSDLTMIVSSCDTISVNLSRRSFSPLEFVTKDIIQKHTVMLCLDNGLVPDVPNWRLFQ